MDNQDIVRRYMHPVNFLKIVAQQESKVSGGVIIVTSIMVAVSLIVPVVLLQIDYRRHKRPLKAADPNVDYTFWHHIRVVSIPLMSYRISFYISKKDQTKKYTRQ